MMSGKPKIRWTKEHVDFALSLRPKYSVAKIAEIVSEKFGIERTEYATKKALFRAENKSRAGKELWPKNMIHGSRLFNMRKFKFKEREFLRLNYMDFTVEQLLDHLQKRHRSLATLNDVKTALENMGVSAYEAPLSIKDVVNDYMEKAS